MGNKMMMFNAAPWSSFNNSLEWFKIALHIYSTKSWSFFTSFSW